MNTYIDINSNDFKLFIQDLSKIHDIMKQKKYDIKIMRKITKNKKYTGMDHFNVIYLINKLYTYNYLKEDFQIKLMEINIKPLQVQKNTVKYTYKKKDNIDDKKNDDKTSEEKEKEEEEKQIEEDDDDDKNINDSLIELGVDDGVFRYLFFMDLDFKFLKYQIKKSFGLKNNNSLIYVNELINILTSHIFSKYKESVFILDINLQKQALRKYFNNENIVDENTCSICLNNINIEIKNHHTIFCLSCSAVYCTECYNKMNLFCGICRKKIK